MTLHTWMWGFWVRKGSTGPGFYLGVDDGIRLFSQRQGMSKVWTFCGLKFHWLERR